MWIDLEDKVFEICPIDLGKGNVIDLGGLGVRVSRRILSMQETLDLTGGGNH